MIAEQTATVAVDPSVRLEGRVAVPPEARAGVVICHPHPLYGGDMDNPVVTRAAEACASRAVATLRFNFRGVGTSTGRHDEGRGEQADVRAALEDLGRRLPPGGTVALAGYSFGAAVVAAVAQALPVAGLALIAPPMRVQALAPPAGVSGPIVIIVGSEDQYCPASALEQVRQAVPQARIVTLEGADHFFLGSLEPLGAAVADWAGALARPA